MRRKLLTYAPYLVLTLAIMAPLLLPGYILTHDMVFTPSLRMPSEISNDYLWLALLHLLDIVLPSQLIQKVILVGIPLIAAIGMHRLVSQLPRGTSTPAAWSMATYLAGIFYAVNPFTYSRFMAGQYGVLLGYMLVPYFVLALLRFYREPSYRKSWQPLLIAVVVAIISVHTVGLLALAAISLLIYALWQRHDAAYLRRLLRYGAAAIGIFLVVNSYWLVPALAGKGAIGDTVQGFDATHSAAFASVGDSPFERIYHIMDLQGFWLEERGAYQLPQDRLVGWGTVRLLVWLLIGWGAVALWRTRQSLALSLGLLGVMAITFAVGFPQGILTATGYREPHKFVGLVALVFAVLLAYGAARFLSRCQQRSELRLHIAAGFTGLIVLLFTPTMYWGFAGQLQPRHYPESWRIINTTLLQDTGDYKVLFLPWHQYMRFDFSGRIIAAPTAYFDAPMVTSNDPELGDIRPPSNADATKIGALLQTPDNQLAQKLAAYGIKYIILAKDHDYTDYAYLDSAKTLKILTDTPDMRLYRNTSYKENR